MSSGVDARLIRRRLLVSMALVGALPAFAQTVGQEGKDVLWVPTPDDLVDIMMRMARVGADDVVIDLGSGDGRIPIAAAKKFGARAIGIEYDADMVIHARRRAGVAGVGDRVEFRQADIFDTDFSKATVIAVYLMTALNVRLRPKILALKPGTRVVAHQYGFGDEWDPDAVVFDAERRALLWIVPARIEGTWRLHEQSPAPRSFQPIAGELVIRQKFQKIGGEFKRGDETDVLTGAQLRGERISFAVDHGPGERHFYGRVGPDGKTMRGVSTDGLASTRWNASRIA